MRRIVGGLPAAIPGLSSIAVVLGLLFYVFAVIATNLFGADKAETIAAASEALRRATDGTCLDLVEQRMHMTAGRADQVQKLVQLGYATDASQPELCGDVGFDHGRHAGKT